ncbi:response regulator [Campylobacter geochelonis]|uniref:Cation-efflux system membrane protein n=1 Tax=Campylobacter geochelonis TaxID=1780362 RepID=A0A128EG76_9BACT|nr:response regulator [Campylobacter geochelonis]CZE47597.1 cation-efflux system membrane protein [Campylobacter geochelonis]CZE48523.1 cation-efflux system membrane protein [Campylobacter geochelonis]CZE51166.1 cation-efflux system membrane protein [Campylobacter geochelonis]
MRILIVENEVYLAQSIASKLTSLGHECEILTDIKDVLNAGKKDAVLLSTNIFGENIYAVIDKFKDSIIILLITYINNDNVSKPIKAGANDYIQKPFMVEELVRKLDHFEEFDKLKNINKSFSKYFEFYFSSICSQEFEIKNTKFPFFIVSSNQILADKFLFEMSRNLNLSFKFIFLDMPNSLEILENENFCCPLYLINFHTLKYDEKMRLFSIIQKKQVVVSTTNFSEDIPFEQVVLKEDSKGGFEDKILSIDEYFKHIITSYQSVFPDTELSKRLGISRKSLWEKRKKYGIDRKK